MTVVWLIGACALLMAAARWPGAAAPLRVAALVMGCVGGTTLPDIDFWLPFGHRSALTHSLIPVLVALAWPRWWPVAAGLALGVGLHLGADAFPNAMRGYALVKVPLAGALSPGESRAWLGAQALGGLALGAWLAAARLPRGWAAAALAACAAVGATYWFTTDGGWPPLAIAGGGAAGAGWWRARRAGAPSTRA